MQLDNRHMSGKKTCFVPLTNANEIFLRGKPAIMKCRSCLVEGMITLFGYGNVFVVDALLQLFDREQAPRLLAISF